MSIIAPPEGWTAALFQKLWQGEWIDAHDNLASSARRQELAGLRHRPDSLSRQSVRPSRRPNSKSQWRKISGQPRSRG